MLTRVSKLADKAMLVKLTIRRAPLTRRDTGLTLQLQAQENDQSLTVLTKLFKDKGSPVHQIMQKVNEVYTYHRTHTLPYVDAGPRILSNGMYFEYTQEMQHRIAQVENLLNKYMPLYDQLVQDDIAFRNNGQPIGRAKADEYPTADQFRRSMNLEYRFMPMPDTRHFLFDLSDHDLNQVEQAEQEAVQAANADIINRMLKPLSALVSRLDEYQGEKGQRFHNSVVENVVEGCKLARKLAIAPTPELLTEIEGLEKLASNYLDHVEVIKGSAQARSEARRKLEEAANRMSAYF